MAKQQPEFTDDCATCRGPGFVHPVARRSFLLDSGCGFGALALAAMLNPNLVRAETAGLTIDPLRPFAPRKPHFEPKAKTVIFLYLVGGPSQIDTFDYKPELQKLDGKPVPDSIRAAVEKTSFANVFVGCKPELMASPFQFKQYGQSGMWLSELHPHLSRHVDELCFLHSLQAESNNHAPASYQMHTGDIRPGKASLGSWVTYGLGSENQDLPAYVALFQAGPLGGSANYSNGFLPAAFQPTRLRDQGAPVLDLTPPEEFAARQRESIDLARRLNLRHLEQNAGATELEARIASYELAYRMQSAALNVGDFSMETATTQTMYGLDHQEERTRAFARKCLFARRLVEQGVRFVQLYDMVDKDGWDAHGDLVANHRPRALWTDQPIAALLTDLKQRGLLETTLVICASEFGRTPMMQGDRGRQHNAAGFTIWLCGGGVKSGQRIGATDEIGLMAVDRPTHFRDLHATLLAALGIDHEALLFHHQGRPERLTGVANRAKIIDGLLT